ncbi:MAG: sugar phosphate nucleotidyltransferase [candidate division WOR-3 bacterium]|nr:sugar phosphate nucleotidyltransferase [candidate division WOR-3 bacterium]MDW8151267.1 sugar phosphate nucleotidyltransferase [candidate division WOR-3 bacterium]
MKLILPTAGKGTRLRPFSLYRSKSLLKVYSKPIIQHLMESIERWTNFDEIILVISPDENGYKTYEFLKSIYPNTSYRIQEKTIGLADAVYVGINNIEEDVLIVLPDALYSGSFDFSENFIAVKEVEDPTRFGIVILDGNYVIDLEEKPENPKTNLAISGIYYIKDTRNLEKSIKKLYEMNVKTKNEYQLTDALRIFIKENKIRAIKIDEWYDCGKVETYLETMLYILKKEGTNILSSSESSTIVDPVFIDKDCHIENSTIGPFVDISQNCIIKNSSIENSIIMENTIIENSNIENSIIGSNCKIVNFSGEIILGDFGKLISK